jgi:hypothetical protein
LVLALLARLAVIDLAQRLPSAAQWKESPLLVQWTGIGKRCAVSEDVTGDGVVSFRTVRDPGAIRTLLEHSSMRQPTLNPQNVESANMDSDQKACTVPRRCP